MVEPSLPFYLSQSENPGAMITMCVRIGDNYDLWPKSMLNALKAKNKKEFVDGSLAIPQASSPEAHNWKACNSMLILDR